MNIPRDWANADQLDGYDFVNKGELIGSPFKINSAEFYHNANGVHFVNIEAEDIARKPFAFNDSSTGVRQQLLDYLTTRLGHEPGEGIVYPMDLVAPQGLRTSEYGIGKDNRPVSADSPLAVRKAVTYYLTTSGRPRRESAPEPASALKMGKTKAPAKKAVRRSETVGEYHGAADQTGTTDG
jgi:hypothetical protein